MTPSIKLIAPLLLIALICAPACGESETAEEASGCQASSDKLQSCFDGAPSTVDLCQEEFESLDSSCQSASPAFSFCIADLSCAALVEHADGILDDAVTDYPCSEEVAVLEAC